MVFGNLVDILASDQIETTIADVGQDRFIAASKENHGTGRTHPSFSWVVHRFLEDGATGRRDSLLDGALQGTEVFRVSTAFEFLFHIGDAGRAEL